MSAKEMSEKKYRQLVSKTLPHVIHNEHDLELFTEELWKLDGLDHPSPEESELAELLTTLIQKYEAETYQLRKARPVEVMEFLIEQRGVSHKDLVPLFGSKGNVSEILSGKRNIGVATAVKLGEFFHVAPELFIEWSATTAPAGSIAASRA